MTKTEVRRGHPPKNSEAKAVKTVVTAAVTSEVKKRRGRPPKNPVSESEDETLISVAAELRQSEPELEVTGILEVVGSKPESKPKPKPAATLEVTKSKTTGTLERSDGKTVASSLVSQQVQKSIGRSVKLKPVRPSFGMMPHISTGSMVVNFLIGGSKSSDGTGLACPGFPRRKITEVFGVESCGKTTLALSAVAQCQREGGLVMFLDFEQAIHWGYAKKLGVVFDEDRLLYYQPMNMEQGLAMIYIGMKLGVDMIVVDSVAAMVPKVILDNEMDKQTIGVVARIFSTNLPKIVQWLGQKIETKPNHPGTALVMINQVRATISVGHGKSPHETNTSGGKALKFYATIRLGMKKVRSDVVEMVDPITLKKQKQPYGNLVTVRVAKNKIDAKEGHWANIFIRYGSGIDDIMTMMEAATARNIISKNGSIYQYKGNQYKGRDRLRNWFIENPEEYSILTKNVTEALDKTVSVSTEYVDEGDDLIIAEARRIVGEGDVDEEYVDDGEGGEEVVEDSLG